MHEHIAPAVYYLEVHLLYASIVCLAAWVLTSLWRGNSTWKYWIWVVTSLNFLVPLGGFFNRFGAVPSPWASQLAGLDAVGIGISRNLTIGVALLALWLAGAALMLARLLLRLRRLRRGGRTELEAERSWLGRAHLTRGVPVRLAAVGEAPSVDGMLRPYISLPLGIERLLSEPELDAVLMHEITHARRRDNLIGLLHELALCALWFHPMLWLAGYRLAMFRELSCDDSVIANSRGADLLSALSKLAAPQDSPLRSAAGSLLSHRVARLTIAAPAGGSRAADWLLVALFGGSFLACLFGTIAHNPSCFKVGL